MLGPAPFAQTPLCCAGKNLFSFNVGITQPPDKNKVNNNTLSTAPVQAIKAVKVASHKEKAYIITKLNMVE